MNKSSFEKKRFGNPEEHDFEDDDEFLKELFNENESQE
jgi:hypothetical protein